MSHVRKDTFVQPFDWCKHLRPYSKRRAAKAERQMAKKLIRERVHP